MKFLEALEVAKNLYRQMKEFTIDEIEIMDPAENIKIKLSRGIHKVIKPEYEVVEKKEKKETSEEKLIVAPISGIFYRAPSPDKPPYVDAGKKINSGDVICIIEAMKVFNEIKSPKSGVIKEIPVANGSPVKKGDVLFILE